MQDLPVFLQKELKQLPVFCGLPWYPSPLKLPVFAFTLPSNLNISGIWILWCFWDRAMQSLKGAPMDSMVFVWFQKHHRIQRSRQSGILGYGRRGNSIPRLHESLGRAALTASWLLS